MRRTKKGIEAQREKTPTSTQAIDVFIRDEEHNEKQKKKNRERAPNPVTLDPSVVFYDPQGSHGEPILLTNPQPTRGEL